MQLAPEKYLSYLIGVLVSLVLFSLILLAFGYSPITSLEGILTGSFGSIFNASTTFEQMAPFLLSALAFLVAFKGRFYNIGVEGQIYMGALVSYLVASRLGGVPSIIAIPAVAAAAFVGGTAWLALPLLMRIKLQVNEIFPTLVMNFVALDVINWLTTGPIKDAYAVNPQTPSIPQSTWLPVLVVNTNLNLGVIVAVVASVVVFVIIYKTILGYEIRASGSNPRAARAGGVSVSKSTLAVGLISGGLAGIAGMVVLTGSFHLLAQNFSPGYGYQGIGVAALGSFHPLGVLLASALYSALSIGGESLQRLSGVASVPIEIIYLLQATIVLSVIVVQKWVSDRRWMRHG